MEIIVDYLQHFSRKLFQHITRAVVPLTDGEAAGTAQLCFTFLSLCLVFLLLLRLRCSGGLLCIEVLGEPFIWEDILQTVKHGGTCEAGDS